MAPSNVENFSPHVIKQITRELGELTKNPPEGIRVLFDEDDITSIQADIDGPPGTPYFGGSFRIRLVLGKNFPSMPPKGFFVTKIFHPNVGRNGEICVNTLKKDWKQDLGIKHILLTVKCLLIVPNPESALNEEAGKMLLEQYDDYYKRAEMMTEIHAAKSMDKLQQQDQPIPSSSLKDLGLNKTAEHLQQQQQQQNQQHTTTTTMNQTSNSNSKTDSNKSSSCTSHSGSGKSTSATSLSHQSTSAIHKNRGLKRVLRSRS